jgi:hypothetical protein
MFLPLAVNLLIYSNLLKQSLLFDLLMLLPFLFVPHLFPFFLVFPYLNQDQLRFLSFVEPLEFFLQHGL